MQTIQSTEIQTANASQNDEIKSIPGSRIYRRETIAALDPTANHSIRYSRSVARGIFERNPQINVVEYVTTGRKTDSQYVGTRGENHPPEDVLVYVCSTGGKWGKSKRVFPRFSLARMSNF